MLKYLCFTPHEEKEMIKKTSKAKNGNFQVKVKSSC